MLDLSKYHSIGEALKDALDQFANEVCLIEADREREKERLTYRDFKERAHPLAKALQNASFAIRTLAAPQALRRQRSHYGISDLAASQRFCRSCGCDERPGGSCYRGAGKRYSCRRATLGRVSRRGRTGFRSAQPARYGLHCLLLWDWRTPQRLHDDARKLSGAVRRAHFALSLLAGRALPQHIADESRHRFHGGFFRTVHLWGRGRSFTRVASRICARGLSKIQDYLCQCGASRIEKPAERTAGAFQCVAGGETQSFRCSCCHQQGRDKRPAKARHQPLPSQTGS